MLIIGMLVHRPPLGQKDVGPLALFGGQVVTVIQQELVKCAVIVKNVTLQDASPLGNPLWMFAKKSTGRKVRVVEPVQKEPQGGLGAPE